MKWQCDRCGITVETDGNEPAYCECCGNVEFNIKPNDTRSDNKKDETSV